MHYADTPVLVGHSDYLPALAGYDVKSPLMGLPPRRHEISPQAYLAREAHLLGGFYEVFVPPIEPPVIVRSPDGFDIDYPPPLDRAYALERTLAGIRGLLELTVAPESRVRLVRSVAEIEMAHSSGEIAAVLHLADADTIDPDLDTLSVLHAAGLRSIAVTWSRSNAFGYGARYRSPGHPDDGPGLTEQGRALVSACNRLGILVDLAHLNEAGFRDVAKVSSAPLVMSHGAAHALTPTSRAATDAQLKAIAESGGLIGVSSEGMAMPPEKLVEAMVAHIRYIADRAGIDCVAFGSDLYRPPSQDNPEGVIPLGEVLTRLREAGWTDRMLDQLAWGNWRRVLAATWGG
jgi:membrane dipeptidase